MLNLVIYAISLKVNIAFSGKLKLNKVTKIINYKVLIVPQSIYIEDDKKMFMTKFPNNIVLIPFFT